AADQNRPRSGPEAGEVILVHHLEASAERPQQCDEEDAGQDRDEERRIRAACAAHVAGDATWRYRRGGVGEGVFFLPSFAFWAAAFASSAAFRADSAARSFFGVFVSRALSARRVSVAGCACVLAPTVACAPVVRSGAGVARGVALDRGVIFCSATVAARSAVSAACAAIAAAGLRSCDGTLVVASTESAAAAGAVLGSSASRATTAAAVARCSSILFFSWVTSVAVSGVTDSTCASSAAAFARCSPYSLVATITSSS